jgi:hypothetical protein
MVTPRPRTVIVGTVRNVEKKVERELNRLLHACRDLDVIETFFVESDSSDKTIQQLSKIRQSNSRFNFESLGDLEGKIPSRIERIRFCRNHYVQYIRKSFRKQDLDLIIVADMDGINSRITKMAIQSCIKESGWDGLFSNQVFGISDLLALRARDWLERDYLQELEESRVQLRSTGVKSGIFWNFLQFFRYDKTRRESIYRRMLIVWPWRKLIPVDSYFGGIAIYKSWCFFDADYITDFTPNECEHVAFHRSIQLMGGRLFLNPRFINSLVNTYNVNKFFLIRTTRFWWWNRKKK